MTDIVEPVMNGEGDLGDVDSDITERNCIQDEQDGDSNPALICEGLEDVMDTDSNALPDTSLTTELAATEQDEEEDENDDIQENSNAETQDTTDGEGATGEGGVMDITIEPTAQVKIDPDAESNSQIEEPEEDDEEEEEEQYNSAEETEPVLITKISGASKNSHATSNPIRNGEAKASSSDKPLLTGLLEKTDNSKALVVVKTSQLQQRTFSVSDGNAIAKELEEQVSKLNQLLVLKEKEWSAILRLKKHVEYALEQVNCTQRVAIVQDEANGPLSPTDIKACMHLIISEKDAFNQVERQIEESIESTENENESLQTIFPFRSVSQKDSGSASTKTESFTATAALQQLCERKRKAMDELAPGRASTRLRIVDVQSGAPQIQSKIIGNGRKGAIVDVQSIIQSHRSLTGDKPLEKRKMLKRHTAVSSLPMQADRHYLKTLQELFSMVEADKQVKESPPIIITQPPPPTPQMSRSITPKPKNGKTPRQSGNSSSLANPTPSSSSSGTLAKMLSPSTNMGNSRIANNDVTNTSQKYASKLPNADANLSLANLLATSKVETKINITKIKKETRIVREDDSSHVPSQQEAVPICQGCNSSRAQFVCAGCANQWYCSRECQVAAWDEHSEICSG